MAVPGGSAGTPPIGILTQAYQAHVDEAQAFPGLSIFEGEQLSTEKQGRIVVRAGRSTLTLAESTEAAVFRVTGGIHIDLTAGSVHCSGAKGEVLEVHVAEALLRVGSNQATEAVITLLAPKVLQVTARKGGLNFTYRDEFRFLPEGETYRIYLDAPSEPQEVEGVAAGKASLAGKVAYFIVGSEEQPVAPQPGAFKERWLPEACR